MQVKESSFDVMTDLFVIFQTFSTLLIIKQFFSSKKGNLTHPTNGERENLAQRTYILKRGVSCPGRMKTQ
jgi:hypothetical protein